MSLLREERNDSITQNNLRQEYELRFIKKLVKSLDAAVDNKPYDTENNKRTN